jgi:hypothetical protein
MQLPVLNGIIDRRILINYRVRPDVVQALLPSHLEPLVVNGYASAGVCLLRLKNIGIRYSPPWLRIASENAAHRFLVRFRGGKEKSNAVYIPRRDTDSMLNVVLAGKLLSWPHFPATFAVEEAKGSYSVKMQSKDGHASLDIKAQITDSFPGDSMFASIDHASCCFEGCSAGISPSAHPERFKMIRLKTKTWTVSPLRILSLRSSYFEDASLFPPGSIQFDHALLMEGIEHEWRDEAHGPHLQSSLLPCAFL